jgi:hypothetical protein
MSKGVNLSFGSDPEFILVDRDRNYKSAIGIISGTKLEKDDLGNGHKMFYDNVLMELNVVPKESEAEVIESFRDCFSRASRAVHPMRMLPQASQIFPEQECKHEDAQVFGCEPEFCAYEVTQMLPPTCEKGNCFRSAGGHIHLGYTGEKYPLMAPVVKNDALNRDFGRIFVVRMLDLFVGLPSLFVDHDPTSAARRKLYGRAGTHRPKDDYGVEYRATSNFWLQSPRLTTLVYRLAEFSVQFVADGKHHELWDASKGEHNAKCKAYDVNQLRKVIDNSDKAGAKTLMEKIVKKYLPKDLYAEIFRMAEPTRYDFYTEWGI